MNSEVIKEYLVALGFQLNHPEWSKFQQAINRAGMEINRAAGGMSHSFAVAAGAIGAALTSVVAGTAALLDNTAQADLGYQVFARRMFMSADAAKQLKIATDALGYSLEDIIWGPKELGDRYRQLIKDQKAMQAGLGGEDFEKQMVRLRDMRFEFTRFKVEIQYAAMGLTRVLSRALFGDDDALLKKLKEFNDWLITSLPRLSSELAGQLGPAIKDIVAIGRDLWGVLKDVVSTFIAFTGQVANIDKLKSGQVTIENMAAATERWLLALRNIVDTLKGIYDFLNAGSRSPYTPEKIGGEAGATVRGVIQRMFPELFSRESTQQISPYLHGMRQSPSASAAASEAARVGAATGLNPQFIYEQWAHETGNFKSDLAMAHNNLAGMKNAGGGYRDFKSVREFADAYGRLLSEPRFSGLKGAMSEEQWAEALKSGRYMEDSAQNYSRGMRRFHADGEPISYRGGDTHLGGVTVHVQEPRATPEQIAAAVRDGVHEATGRRTQRNLAQFQEVYS